MVKEVYFKDTKEKAVSRADRREDRLAKKQAQQTRVRKNISKKESAVIKRNK